jgi:hypothetical protein
LLGWLQIAPALLSVMETISAQSVPADEEFAAEVEELFVSGWPGLGTRPAALGAS